MKLPKNWRGGDISSKFIKYNRKLSVNGVGVATSPSKFMKKNRKLSESMEVSDLSSKSIKKMRKLLENGGGEGATSRLNLLKRTENYLKMGGEVAKNMGVSAIPAMFFFFC